MAPDERSATIRESGPAGGSAVADDGSEITFTASAVDPRLRVLHQGQRVRMRIADGRVQAVTLVSFALPATP